MKAIYWQPGRLSLKTLVLLSVASLTAVIAVEACRRSGPGTQVAEQKLEASLRALDGMQTIGAELRRRGHTLQTEYDPSGSGMLGLHLSPVTSLSGHLESKQTTVNPNFAAVILEMLRQAGVGPGDTVAVGYTGSLPAMNLCTCAALETLGARPIVVASAASSQYGANRPDFLWLDMESLLYERGMISFRSVAASYGGYEDRAEGMDAEGQRLLDDAILRNGLPRVHAADYASSLEQRMQLYEEHAAGKPIKCYINVGGGTVSVGRSVGKKLYESGLNLQPTEEALQVDSVMSRFARQGVPVIHLVGINHLARLHGLPIAPRTMPEVGTGGVHYDHVRYRILAAVSLLALFGALWRAARHPSGTAAPRRLRIRSGLHGVDRAA